MWRAVVTILNTPIGHHQNVNTSDSKASILAYPGAALKVLDSAIDEPFLAQYRAENPGALVVGRAYFPSTTTDAVGRTHTMLDRFAKVLHLIDALEVPYNEDYEITASEIAAYADLTNLSVPIIEAEGKDSVVGNFGEQCPPDPSLVNSHFGSALLPSTVPGRVKYFGLHEYSAPQMTDGAGDHCLRWVTIYDLLDPKLRRPLLVTEAGIDGGVLGPDHVKQGYRSFNQPNSGPVFRDNLRWYAQRCLASAASFGVTVRIFVFCCGQGGAPDGWPLFDYAGDLTVLPIFTEVIALGPALPFDPAKINTYAIWATECIGLLKAGHPSSDPRDPLAFRKHLQGIGADPSKPEDYGFPDPIYTPLA